MSLSAGGEQPAEADTFDTAVAAQLFGHTAAAGAPRLTLVVSSSATGRSRATGRISPGSVVLNARDLEIRASRMSAGDGSSPASIAADWMRRALQLARERHLSVVLEGAFRSPDLVTAIAQQFSDAGFETRVVTIAERAAESRMSDASRRLHEHLQPTGLPPLPDRSPVAPVEVLRAVIAARAADLATVWDRDGATVADSRADDPEWPETPARFADAAARPLGTLRSTLWLSELRHMTRALARERTAPRWAVEDLIALHEFALTEIIPELPIAAGSETRKLQEARLAATLSVLRKSVTSEVLEHRGLAVTVPTIGEAGLGR